jgi:para-nitrobenzyl esterase
MASPLSRDYIAGAIGESGALINPTGTPVPLAKAEKNGLDLVEKSGYSFAEFRHLPTSALFEVFNEHRPSLPIVIDGYLLPKTLPEIFAAKEQAQVPLLLGWNSGELPAGAFARPPFSREAFNTSISQRFPDHATKLAELYDGKDGEALEQSISDFGSDNWIVFSTWKWFDLHRNYSEQPVYRYLYSKLRPANDKGEVPPLIGAPHACEIEYAMGNLHLVKGWQWTEEDHKVSATMKGFFANFIKTGNPNSGDLPQWSAAKAKDDSPPVMIINVESKEMPAANDARYRLLDQIYHKK